MPLQPAGPKRIEVRLYAPLATVGTLVLAPAYPRSLSAKPAGGSRGRPLTAPPPPAPREADEDARYVPPRRAIVP